MQCRVIRADPSGNITLFVLDPVDAAERPALAERLMKALDSGIEQVGFACPAQEGADGRLEMAGGEFCGNATRAFGTFLAKQAGKSGNVHMRVEASGCDRIVSVDADLEQETARAEMPLPKLVRQIDINGMHGTLVHLGGIAHLVLEDIDPSETVLERVEPFFTRFSGLDAYGVIFLNGGKLTPLVKVPAAHTLFWEGSCGSGTVAAAVAQSQDLADGEFVRTYDQPAGSIVATVVRQKGEVTAAYIGGTVRFDEIETVEI